MKRLSIAFVVLISIVVGACAQDRAQDNGRDRGNDQVAFQTENSEIKELSDGTKYLVHPSKILSGGPPPDGIPSIDNPEFVSVREADDWLADDELVVTIMRGDVTRAYPFQVLVWHEIVNETIEGEPILITYCPLCGSAIAYEREINGEAVEFGTSGRLYNSNLVMYDRKTRSYWTQIGGQAIVGELTGQVLEPVSINTTEWSMWKEHYPDGEVLSRNTGYRRSYGVDPYDGYYESSGVIFPVENADSRVHPKTVIFGIRVGEHQKAYTEKDLISRGRFEDRVDGVPILVERNEAGEVRFTNLDTGDEIIKERDFWFAWAAFYPDTLLFGRDE